MDRRRCRRLTGGGRLRRCTVGGGANEPRLPPPPPPSPPPSSPKSDLWARRAFCGKLSYPLDGDSPKLKMVDALGIASNDPFEDATRMMAEPPVTLDSRWRGSRFKPPTPGGADLCPPSSLPLPSSPPRRETN